MALKVKTSVKPKIVVMLAAIANEAAKLPFDVTITSANDSKHMQGSKHFSYEALDVRTKNFPGPQAKRAFMRAVLERLGKGYQAVLEYEDGANEHLHIEYDPE